MAPLSEEESLAKARSRKKSTRPSSKRTPKGTDNVATKEFETEQSIHLSIKEALEHMLTDQHETVAQRAKFLQECFPSNTLGQMFSQFLPKAKDTDQGLVESHISLTKSFEALPDVNDLTAHLHILKTELIKANAKIRQLQYFVEAMKKGAPRQQKRVTALFRKLQKDAEEYTSRKHAFPLQGGPWVNPPYPANPLTWEKGLIDIYGLDYAKTLECVMPSELVDSSITPVDPKHPKSHPTVEMTDEEAELSELYKDPNAITLENIGNSYISKRSDNVDTPPGWSW